MNKIFLILKQEIKTTILRRSFILTLILIPVISMTVMLIVGEMQKSEKGEEAAQVISNMFIPDESDTAQGYVDLSGIIQEVPPSVAADKLIRFDSQEKAETALVAGDISTYYIIAQDYIESGTVTVVRSDYNPFGGLEQTGDITRALNYNLLGKDPALVERFQYPMNIEVEYINPTPQRDSNNMLTFFLPYVVTMLFYVILMSSASLMLSSITKEKENRTLEILMTSITPAQMLVGKIIALGIAGLLQTTVWGGAGLLMLRISGKTMNIPAGFQLPISVLLWGILFFLLGYGIYASLMAGLGALVPNMREASQSTIVVIMPLIVPLVMINTLINSPNNGVSVFLSLFPLTSPIAMMTRLAATVVPLWQTLLAAALLAGTNWLCLRSIAGMFRAQTLLSGQSFKLKVFLKALFQRAY